MVPGQATSGPSFFFCFVATILLIFVSISSPTWERVSFLDVTSDGQTTHFGVFGHTGTTPNVGYTFDLANFTDSTLSQQTILNLTKVLIFHPIAAGLSGLAFLCVICEVGDNCLGLRTSLHSLATLLTIVIWIIDMVLFGIARGRFRQHGFQAEYGNANWLTLGALIALFFASPAPHSARQNRKAIEPKENGYVNV